ncbi:MAG: hypothetical protein Ta2E_12520 [Mycoplasmoidaceae bacterium]|nr:MAG: hypothetical protein Ta2E_12520 [Mycoplasmoidaceae bacterium]
MMEACKERLLLVFEVILERFNVWGNDTKVYKGYCRFGENEKYQAFGKKMFILKILSVAAYYRIIKDKKTLRYSVMKNNVRARYDMNNDKNIDFIESD